MEAIAKLSPVAARLLLAILLGAEGRDGAIQMAGISRRSAFRAVAELVRLGWLQKEKRGSVSDLSLSSSVSSSLPASRLTVVPPVRVPDGGNLGFRDIYNNKIYIPYTKTSEQNPPSSAPPPYSSGLATSDPSRRAESESANSDTMSANPDTTSAKTDTSSANPDTLSANSDTPDLDLLLDRCLEADDLPSGNGSMRSDSPFVKKRRAQTQALSALWQALFASRFPPLTSVQAGMLLRAAKESSYLVGLCLQDMETKGERITSPVPYAKKAVEGMVARGWLQPERETNQSDLAEPTPEYLKLLAETQAYAKAQFGWGDDE